MTDNHDPYAALRFPDYRRLLGGSILAALGSEMQAAVVGWELYERTHSEAALGYVGLVQFLPVLFLALPAGQAADRYSRRWLLITAQGLMTLASLGLAVLSFWQGPIPLVYLSLLLVGVGRSFSAPARWSMMPLGAFESGITAEWFGPLISVVGGGIGTILVVLGVRVLWPEVAQLGSLHRAGEEGNIRSE
jgi:MFS family permease